MPACHEWNTPAQAAGLKNLHAWPPLKLASFIIDCPSRASSFSLKCEGSRCTCVKAPGGGEGGLDKLKSTTMLFWPHSMDGEGCGKKTAWPCPFRVQKEKRPGSLRHQWKEEKGLATFEGRKIALLKVMSKRALVFWDGRASYRNAKWDALCKDARLCIKQAAHTHGLSSFCLQLLLACYGHFGYLKNKCEVPMESWSPIKRQTPALCEKFRKAKPPSTQLLLCVRELPSLTIPCFFFFPHCQHIRSFLLGCVRILAMFQVCATDSLGFGCSVLLFCIALKSVRCLFNHSSACMQRMIT